MRIDDVVRLARVPMQMELSIIQGTLVGPADFLRFTTLERRQVRWYLGATVRFKTQALTIAVNHDS